MLTKQDTINLNKINKILKESFGFKNDISNKLSKGALKELRNKAQENMKKIVESSEFNSYHKSPEYNQSMLVVEATNILLNRKSTQSELDDIISKAHNESKVLSTSDKLYELKNMYESYVKKHGENDKAKAMAEKIQGMEKKLYTESVSSKLAIMLKEDADKAEAIMSAKGLLDDMMEYQAKIGETQNKYLDPFIEMVRGEYDNDVADEIYNKLNDSLTELLQKVRETKEVFANVVGILSGEEDIDSMVDTSSGDMESDDLSDMDDEDLEASLSDSEGDEEGLSDSDLEDMLGDEEADEAPEEEFKRREE
jgi:hypothetical protein